jgi:hypothetical protein
MMAEELNLNKEIVRKILIDDYIGMRKISAEMVPRILSHKQKQQQLDVSSDLSSHWNVFKRDITGDETWCFSMTLKQNTKACSGKYQLCQDRKR